MMFNCRIKYKDEMNEVFLKETSVKYLIKILRIIGSMLLVLHTYLL